MKRTSSRTERPIVRPAIDADPADMAVIDRLAFESRWEVGDFKRFLVQPKSIGFVAERDDRVVGYALVNSFDSRLQLVRIAVHPRHWDTGVGQSLLRLLKSGLRREGRTRILADVSDRNLPAQMFLKACGFRAIAAVESFFAADEGAIKMEFRLMPRDTMLDFFCFRRARQL